MAKISLPFGKAKTVPMPKVPPESPEDRQIRAKAGSALAQMQSVKPKAPKAAAAKPAPRAFTPGLSGQQYAGEKLKDYSAMKPKLATKDKVLNPVKRAVGLPGKPAKMVPKR